MGLAIVGCQPADTSKASDSSSSSPASSSSSSASSSEVSSSEVSVSDDSTSSSVWIDYGKTELTQEMLDAVTGDNITLEGRMFLGMSSMATPYGIQLKYTGDAYLATFSTMSEDWESGEEFPLTQSSYYFKGEEGDAMVPQSPDKNNVVAQDTGDAFDSGFYTNPLALFDATDFALDYTYSGPGYKFSWAGSDDQKAITAYANIASSVTQGMYTFYGDLLTDLSIYTDGNEITGLGISATSSDESMADYGLLVSIQVGMKDVGTTEIDAEAVATQPYAVPEGQEEEYEAFQSALDKIAAKNYHFDVEVTDSTGTVIQESEAYVTADGWAGSDAYPADKTISYYGVHKNEDGTFDYYGGSAPDELAPSYKAYAAYHHLPAFDFAKEIFELDEEQSTEDVYVFTLRDSFTESYYASAVTNEVTYDTFGNTGIDLTFEVNKDGTMKGFVFHYTDSDDKTSTFTQTYDSFGTVESIPTSIADFTNYTPLAVPTSWDDASDTDGIPLTMMLGYMENGDAAVFPVTENLKPYYMNFISTFGTDTISIQANFVKETTYDSASELYELAIDELEKLLDTTFEATNPLYMQESATVDGLTYTVAVLSNYVVAIDITGPMIEMGA